MLCIYATIVEVLSALVCAKLRPFILIEILRQLSGVCVSAGQIIESVDSCTGTRYSRFMIRSFRHRGLRRLYERDDPSRIAADLLDRIALALADLDAAGKPSDLDLPGYRLHPLRGNLRGLWSISITGNWRVTFRFEAGDVYDVDLVDYHQCGRERPCL